MAGKVIDKAAWADATVGVGNWRGEFEGGAHGASRFTRALDVEPHATTEKIVRVQAPEQQIRVADGQLRTLPVADVSGVGPGAARAYSERAAGIDIGD